MCSARDLFAIAMMCFVSNTKHARLGDTYGSRSEYNIYLVPVTMARYKSTKA